MKKSSITLLIGFSCLLSNAQNVGIGTTTPVDKLTVQTNPNNFGITHTDNTIKLSTFIGGGAGGAWMGTQSNHPFHIYTNNGVPQVSFNTNYSTDFKERRPCFACLMGVQYPRF